MYIVLVLWLITVQVCTHYLVVYYTVALQHYTVRVVYIHAR